MSDMEVLLAALDAEFLVERQAVEKSHAECRRLVAAAFQAKAAGDLSEARILLNEALDEECDTTGDYQVLGDLSEEWQVDHDRDKRANQTAVVIKISDQLGQRMIFPTCQICGLLRMSCKCRE
jgi:hypothetical protein